MRTRHLFLLGVFVLGLPHPAAAGECGTSNIALALELSQPTWTGGTAGFREPFATIFQDELGLTGTNCSSPSDCPFSDSLGKATCGDLVGDPLDHYGRVELGSPEPIAFSELAADLLPDATWSVAAQGLITPAAGASQEVTRTYAAFSGGFRDVLDVSSTETTPQSLLIDVRIRRGDFDVVGCFGEILRRIALVNELRFRVLADPVGDDPAELKVDASSGAGTLGLGHNVFPIEVSPNSTLWLDVYLAASVQATGYNIFEGCTGGHAIFDMGRNATGTEQDGIQVFLTPAPTLTVSSQGGLGYEPVPEPVEGAASVAVAALATLARRHRRASRTSAARAAAPPSAGSGRSAA
jgi:hypothetical protein